jgi:hypothetical protein
VQRRLAKELRESAACLSAALTQHEHAAVIRDLVLRCAYGHVAWQQRTGDDDPHGRYHGFVRLPRQHEEHERACRLNVGLIGQPPDRDGYRSFLWLGRLLGRLGPDRDVHGHGISISRLTEQRSG